jgi:hypothetical protein
LSCREQRAASSTGRKVLCYLASAGGRAALLATAFRKGEKSFRSLIITKIEVHVNLENVSHPENVQPGA